MERNWAALRTSEGRDVYLNLENIAVLEPGPGTGGSKVTLGNGGTLLLADDVTRVETALGEFRLRGVNGYRINPDHIVAVESTGPDSCHLHLSCGLLLVAEHVAAKTLGRALRQQQKYPWDTMVVREKT